jgi:hypothetical protein
VLVGGAGPFGPDRGTDAFVGLSWLLAKWLFEHDRAALVAEDGGNGMAAK